MEVSVSFKTTHFPDIRNIGGSLTTDPHNLIHNKEDLSMSKLKTCLTELLNVEETSISTIAFDLAHQKNHDISNGAGESKCMDLEKSSAISLSASEKCLSKCATFPPPRAPKLSGDVFVDEKGKHVEDINADVSEGNGSTKPFNQFYSRSTSLPVPLKLVSALKGSREKKQQGTSPKKRSVTWAPDVYDPIPTSVSHVPSDKNQRYRNSKRYGKYKQKSSGKSSRGSKSKDKKQVRKSSGSSSKPKQPFYMDNRAVLCESRPHGGTLDYNVASPDPFCGSSFLKGSVTKLHFPVAEAT